MQLATESGLKSLIRDVTKMLALDLSYNAAMTLQSRQSWGLKHLTVPVG